MQQFSGSEGAGCSQTARIAIAACKHGRRRRMSVGRYGGEPGVHAVAMQCGLFATIVCRAHGTGNGVLAAVDGEGRVEGGRVQGKCKHSVYVRHGTRGHARGQQWHEGETSGLCRADGGALQGGQRRCLGRRSTASLVSAHRAWKSTNPSAQVVGCDATGIDGHHRIGSTQANLNCRSER